MLTKHSNLVRFLFLLAAVFLSVNFAFAQSKDTSDTATVLLTESSISGTIVIEGDREMPQEFRFSLLKSDTGERTSSEYNYSQNAREIPQQNFRIGRLKQGKYRIIFADRNYYVKFVTVGGETFAGDTFIEVKAGEQISNVHIVLATDFGAVTGKVENFNGEMRTIVVLMKEETEVDQLQARTFTAMVKPNGEFSIKAVPGEYKIYVYMPKNYEEDKEKMREWIRKTLENAPNVTVKANETTNVTLNMPN